MGHWNFKFIGNKWKMAHTVVCQAIRLYIILKSFYFYRPDSIDLLFFGYYSALIIKKSGNKIIFKN